jgi:hypothetical protein
MPKSWRLTPDCSENPFWFFFQNQKDCSKSGNKAGKMPELFGSNLCVNIILQFVDNQATLI